MLTLGFVRRSSLSGNRQHLSNDDCPEDKWEDYQNCCVLYSVSLCAVFYIFAGKARIDNQKKEQYVNMSSRCPHNIVNFGPLAAEIALPVGAPQLISTAFASWLHYCTAVK